MSGNHLDVTIDSLPVKALVDSGASSLVVSVKFRQYLKKVMFPAPNHTVLKVANGNFLKASGALIDCGRTELTLDDVEVTSEEVVLKPLCLCAMKDYRLPAYSIMQISVVNHCREDSGNIIVKGSKLLALKKEVNMSSMLVTLRQPFCLDCIATISETSRVPTEISETKQSFEFLKMISPDLDANQKQMLLEMLQKYSEAFKERKNGTPQITVKHRINTDDNLPVKQRAYHVSPEERRIIHDEVGKMLDRGIIQPSERLKDPSGRLARWALCLQEYDLEIVSKSGKKQKDAESLSRNPVEDEVFPYQQKTTLASFSDIAEEQRKDPAPPKLIHTQEKEEPVTKSFNLIEGIFCKKNFDPNGR
ncbi:transposon Ty3-I Gag-Pol polyprotein [Trichonephila inaurata madagascariensis]|uniref:Transposon Ty3-I Gag-Pol polyprotein n=1 Tax=Trichonephila inaurata madagascariensis TaxID=2747483 RepID=A0A8X6YK74_9ARAC|nr:transposon Ty3-I Gag-Pol polyprotein [Trichonephila inaurata madagascariensis]